MRRSRSSSETVSGSGSGFMRCLRRPHHIFSLGEGKVPEKQETRRLGVQETVL
jgi:hypothetical protein